jgi:dipeptidyl-peptidase-4
MSVAPVTDWRLYDSIYTERYMHLPQDNPNYYNSSVLPLVSNFDPAFLLVHGLADDNVQFINSAALEEALIAENKVYTTRFYPNRDHGITGGNTRYNLYAFLIQHLQRYLL